jgi:exopolyphosphatase / guanosine-5'-triphosphate,3'-diphosphate pyrophosphatase
MSFPIRGMLDFGSNALKLVVCEFREDTLYDLYDEEVVTKLGSGILKSGKLSDEAISRTLDATTKLLNEIDNLHLDSLDAIGTWALRNCSNLDQFKKLLNDKFDLDLRILNPSEEAAAGYLAVKKEFSDRTDASVTFDLGGGSGEICYGSGNLPEKFSSMEIGARNMYRRATVSDPPTSNEIEQIALLTNQILNENHIDCYKGRLRLIGGAAATLAGYAQGLIPEYIKEMPDFLSLEMLDILISKLSRMSVQERQKVRFVNPDRADVVLHGAIIFRELMRSLNQSYAKISLRGLQHGLYEAERIGLPIDLDAPIVKLPKVVFPPLTRDDRNGEVLFILRTSEGKIWLQRKFEYPAGIYRLPGGGVDLGEASCDAIIREVKEETSISNSRPIPMGRLTYVGPNDEPINWFSDLYLVDLGDFYPTPEDDEEGIEDWVAEYPVDGFDMWISKLENMDDERREWGIFRAAAMHYIKSLSKRNAI